VTAAVLTWGALVVPPLAAASATNTVVVAHSTMSKPLPAGYVGLALEFSTPPRWFGAGPNPVFDQLLRNIDPAGRPVIRIGGASTERSWFPVVGMKQPLGITDSLGASWLAAMRALAQGVDARLLLGVNLEADSRPIAKLEVQQYLQGIGSQYVQAIEIGNEPNLYTRVPWYRRIGSLTVPWYSKTGTPVYARRASYDAAAWARDYARILNALPSIPVAGPDSGDLTFLSAFKQFVSPGSQVRMIVAHAYGLNSCVPNPTSPGYPTVKHLLALTASRSLVSSLGPYIALAHQNSATFRIDEMGSVSCNGRAGVSNTMASALWLMDALMSLWSSGVDGVNLHTFPHEINNLFDLSHSQGRWVGRVHPLYYGALMFALAVPRGARLLEVDSSSEAQLRSWATLSRGGVLRVLLINDNQNRQVRAAVTVPPGFRSDSATVLRLTAASAEAAHGLSIGTVGFGPRTTTGVLPTPVTTVLTPRHGTFRLQLGGSSAALLTLSAPYAPPPSAPPSVTPPLALGHAN
jgi:hypothetical protein